MWYALSKAAVVALAFGGALLICGDEAHGQTPAPERLKVDFTLPASTSDRLVPVEPPRTENRLPVVVLGRNLGAGLCESERLRRHNTEGLVTRETEVVGICFQTDLPKLFRR